MQYGLLGHPLGHSYSKEIHETLGKYEYTLNDVTPEGLVDFVKARNFKGFNVTIPYKKDVIPLCDQVSDLARQIGAVNTLYFKGDKLCGHNTDYEGFLYSAKRAGIVYTDRTVLVLGTGGASLAAIAAVKQEKCKKLYIASIEGTDGPDLIEYDQIPDIANEVQVIVNATPVGTYPHNLQKLVTLTDFPNLESVMDVIYNPFKTKLLLEAEALGLHYSNGLPMLVAQATAAAGYFLGTPGAFEEKNEEIISAMEAQMRNIVLIGMPGCGKSTVAKVLGNITGKPVIDMDEEIIRRAGKPIPEIFANEGEKAFRDLEAQVAFDLGKEKGQIIATGGGAILRPENVDALRQNALVIYLERPLHKLPTNGRPLSKDMDALKAMEKIRKPLYEAAADLKIDNSRYLSKSKLEAYIRESLGELI